MRPHWVSPGALRCGQYAAAPAGRVAGMRNRPFPPRGMVAIPVAAPIPLRITGLDGGWVGSNALVWTGTFR